jgi:hypothetical protein
LLAAGAPPTVAVADVKPIAPVYTLEILVNGEVVQTVKATDPLHLVFDGQVPPLAPAAARAIGQKSIHHMTTIWWRQTSPVWIAAATVFKTTDVQFRAIRWTI